MDIIMSESLNVNVEFVLEERHIKEILQACARQIVNPNGQPDSKEGIKVFYKYFNQEKPLVDINKPIPGQKTWTPLAMATFLGKVDEALTLLKMGASPNVKLDKKINLLHMAATEGNGTLCFHFLENMKNSDPSFIDAQCEFGQTALMRACEGGHLDVVKVLMKYKPNIMLKDNNDKTCFDYGIDNQHYNLIKFINHYHLQNTVPNKDNLPNKKKVVKI